MKRVLRQGLVLALLSWAMGTPASAAPRTAADVVALGSAPSGQVVEFAGEAIGEPIRASEGEVWVNVLSGGLALGVVMRSADAEAISHFGRYQRVGDTVRVTGVYNVGCDTHGGDVDVHAMDVDILDVGHSTPDAPAVWQLGVAAGLFAVGAVSLVRYAQARRRYEGG